MADGSYELIVHTLGPRHYVCTESVLLESKFASAWLPGVHRETRFLEALGTCRASVNASRAAKKFEG